jgi:phage gp46-like protein
MSSLALRKQLLIAESELNRAELVEESQSLAAEVRSLAVRARTLRSLASATASLIVSLMSSLRAKSAPAQENHSWWRTFLKGAQLAGSLWMEFCPRPKS